VGALCNSLYPDKHAIIMFRLAVVVCISAALLGTSIVFSQEQQCENLFIAAKENAELEYVVFDRKGKEVGKMLNKVILAEETRNGTVYHFESTFFDPNAQILPQRETYSVRCQKDTLFVSMKCMLASGTLESYSSMQMQMEGKDLPFPAKLRENESLPDASMTLEVSSGGMRVMTVKASTTERKVEKKEKITTSAGEFNCIKITEKTEVKVGFITTKTKTDSWYATGVGLVKQEIFDKKGRLDSRKELFKLLN
jgi:hypothetical protein